MSMPLTPFFMQVCGSGTQFKSHPPHGCFLSKSLEFSGFRAFSFWEIYLTDRNNLLSVNADIIPMDI